MVPFHSKVNQIVPYRTKGICKIQHSKANAYGSIRHNLIHFAMEWYHFPPWLCKLIFCYYDKIFAFVVTKNGRLTFFALQIGLFQGCCMSVMIFNVIFQMLLDYHSQLKLPEEKNWLCIQKCTNNSCQSKFC